MPAIQPAKLRREASELAELFNDPLAYLRELHHLLEFYAERARRQGQSGMPRPLTLAYNVHPQALRLLMQEVIPKARENPEQGLVLCDALWKENKLEMRLMAARLLGQIPFDDPEATLARVGYGPSGQH